MKIAIDIRSLQSNSVSGVENYIFNLVEKLLSIDKDNEYILFFNNWQKKSSLDKLQSLRFVNSRLVYTAYPNRLLNLALMTRVTNLEKIIGDFDVLFMPNPNQYNIGEKKKLAITVHDLSPLVSPSFYDLKRKMWHKLVNFRKILARAEIVFAVSEHTKLDLVRLCDVDEKKILVCYPGVDKSVFSPQLPVEEQRRVRNKLGLPSDYILFMNTIEPRKNLSGLLKAFELLTHPIELVVAGKPGWKYRNILREIKNSGKSNKIRYLGYVNEKDKPGLIKLSRMLIYPSFYEGFGFQPLEAMAMGVPAVVSQTTSLPEVTGGASLLVDPYDPHSIYRAITTIIEQKELSDSLIHSGLVQAQKYNWRKTAEQVLAGLNKLK